MQEAVDGVQVPEILVRPKLGGLEPEMEATRHKMATMRACLSLHSKFEHNFPTPLQTEAWLILVNLLMTQRLVVLWIAGNGISVYRRL